MGHLYYGYVKKPEGTSIDYWLYGDLSCEILIFYDVMIYFLIYHVNIVPVFDEHPTI